jgi:hypothetical protein
MFAAYVNENHPWVDAVRLEALQTGLVRNFTDYQAGDPKEVIRQVFAIWNVLQRRGICYSSATTPSAYSGIVYCQNVRLFDESITYKQANCVDGSVLMAAILAKIGLLSYLVVVPGHMFVGISALAVAAALLIPPMAQPLEYHDFADQREAFGIHNFLDVASNGAFLIVGVIGMVTFPSRPAWAKCRGDPSLCEIFPRKISCKTC